MTVLWGSQLSPFFLKVEALCRYAGLPAPRRPDGAGLLETLRLMWRLKRAQWARSVQRWPASDPLDEYPLVPYLMTDDGAVHYDSTGIAGWLDATRPGDAPLIPQDPALGFLCNLLDEAFDEIGLYLVHHHRWVVSREDNDAGMRLANEFRSVLLPPVRPLFAGNFSRRQTRRLPYLFSVAPEDARWPQNGKPVPPGRPGFPATHARIESCWDELVDAAAAALQDRSYLLGERFTLADASLYGQLGMNLSDPSAERRLRERQPRLRAWLEHIAQGRHSGSRGPLTMGAALAPLLSWVHTSFTPLMRANAAAYARFAAQGQQLWNERAFNRGEALFECEWRGAPVRTVVRTFQVRVWRDLSTQFASLPSDARVRLHDAAGTARMDWSAFQFPVPERA